MTVYAFSIENFKRSKYEVDALMDMAKVKVAQLAQHQELMERYGARIQFLGNRDMLRPDVLEIIDRAIEMTSKNGRFASPSTLYWRHAADRATEQFSIFALRTPRGTR